jgi:DNA polymerase-3 subunit alpha
MEINDSTKTKKYIYEAKRNNINILIPDINLSDKKYIIEEKGIRYPLTNIKNVGISATELIIKERENGRFIDIYDFVRRCYGKSVTSKTLESLIYAGVFSEFGYNKKTLITNLDLIINYGELIKDLDRQFALEPEIVKCDEYSSKELMEQELNIFGLYITNNPVTDLKIKHGNIVNLSEIELYFDKVMDTIVYVDKVKEVNTAKGDKMCFISGSDELSTVDIVMFPSVYQKYNDIKQGNIILIKGRVEKRFDKYQIVISNLKRL